CKMAVVVGDLEAASSSPEILQEKEEKEEREEKTVQEGKEEQGQKSEEEERKHHEEKKEQADIEKTEIDGAQVESPGVAFGGLSSAEKKLRLKKKVTQEPVERLPANLPQHPAARGGAASAMSHPLFRRAAEQANANVFESQPQSRADRQSPGPATVDSGETRTVFESKPRPRAVDASGNRVASVLDEARTLIEAAEDATVFESMPRQRSSDAWFGHASSSSVSTSVWESKPAASKADAFHGRQAHAESAQTLIQAAAEQWSSPSETLTGSVVFESQPQQSSAYANATSSKAFESDGGYSSVYENAPVLSRADVTSISASHAAAARAVIEEATEEAEATGAFAQQTRPSPEAQNARQAQELISSAYQAHEGAEKGQAAGFVFESQPVRSNVTARHGEAEVASESEYETDEEDD
ncbi:unnamed protein product, partial [Polarella glacialis]